jgi:pyruvate dehydrogenase E1 component alpha subunit
VARKVVGLVELGREQEIEAYRGMSLIRRFEEKAGQMYGMGLIGGFCHLYIGQEAVVIGMQMATKQGDQVITGYRDHGHMLACGMDPKGVMAELTGRRGGLSRGKGGSMHMFSVEKHFYGGHGIVGAQVSLGTGLAFANRYRENDNVSLTYFGDGAANQGQVYESFNMAELWSLPVVYVIENNRYAMGTSVARASAQTDFSTRGVSFNIPGEQVDGMDVRAVHAAATRAVQWCRRRQWPVHPRNADLPLSRPFHVRPGQVSLQRTKCRRCARSATPSSRCESDCWRPGRSAKTISRRSTPRFAKSSTKPPNSPRTTPSRTRPSSGQTF